MSHKTFVISLTLILGIFLGYGTYKWLNTPQHTYAFEDLMTKAQVGKLESSEKTEVDKLLTSDNPLRIREGISIAMMYKEPTLVNETDYKFRKLITHEDPDVRSGALIGLYKLHSDYYETAYATIVPDKDGLVQNAKNLLDSKK